MAGDWLPIRLNIHDDPAVMAIAAELSIGANEVVGGLVRLWSWFNANTVDGHASVTLVSLDCHAGVAGLCAACAQEGWLTIEDGAITMPNFDRYNSAAAKKRLLATRRKRKGRKEDVTLASRSCRVSVTHDRGPEKRREEKSIKKESTPSLREKTSEKKPRKPNPTWDALVPLFFQSGISRSDAKRLGAACRDLKTKAGVTPDEIRRRHAQVKALEWTTISIEGFVKNWDILDPSKGTGRSPARVNDDNQDRFEKRKPDVIAQ